MFFPVFVIIVLSIIAWRMFGPRRGFLYEFSKLLERPEFVDGFTIGPIRRSFVKGEFRGRNVVVMLQRARGKYTRMVVVSMETDADTKIESYQFAGDRSDKASELALFALEVKHQLKLRHEDGCLKARWGGDSWHSLFDFPGNFDPAKWQSVLEAMHTLSGSLERRAA